MQTQLFDDSGNLINLGQEIARGGEGIIFEVDKHPELVAKYYRNAVTAEGAAKLAAMARVATPDLLRVAAWPTGMLRKAPRGELAGVLLPRVSEHREIHELYNPAQRRRFFPKADWQFLTFTARNLAAAFDVVHSHGHVLGDVNQKGVLVSNKATVKFVDCDSFQFRCNGQLFRCVVGVPEYTAPELQGKSFAAVERTQEHDRFGLALLVFHLLFMGKHPFVGRFNGPGDIPIEKAIVEGRFAFSRSASSFQMAPPPCSFLLQALPDSLAAMFERAFARPNSTSRRPTATEWRVALESLKLATCATDRGHRFPAHLSVCPWCNIMRDGGPNYFISQQVAIGAIRLEAPRIDVILLWKKIEAVIPQVFQRPEYPPRPSNLSPTPFPGHLYDQRLLFKIVGFVLCGSTILTLVGVFIHVLLIYIGSGLSAVFGIWWLVLFANSGFRREMKRRNDTAQMLRAKLQEEQRRWDALSTEGTQRFGQLKSELATIMRQGEQIGAEFEAARRSLEMHNRESQLQEFLDTQYIADHVIPNIGAGRQAMLLSYGIETAADITEANFQNRKGFGHALIGELMNWKDEVARLFVFDPKKPLPQAPLQNLVMKYRQQAQMCEARLSEGAAELRNLRESLQRQVANMNESIFRLVMELRQAEEDLNVRR